MILIFATLTLVGMGGIGAILIETFGKITFLEFFDGPYSLWIEVLAGVTYGIVASLIAWSVVKWPKMNATRTFFENLFRDAELSIWHIVFISICAGVGEEILFRGFIQPYVGLWLTSVLFVAIHGYLNPFNRPLFTYGIVMVVLIAGVGVMLEIFGLLPCIIAHTIIDIFLLNRLTLRPIPDSQ